MFNGKKIVGLVVVRNAIELDYMPLESAMSLAPMCDEVVVSDMESDDGTWEMLNDVLNVHPWAKVVQQPWDRPFQDEHWWTKAINLARSRIDQSAWILHLDSDEVLGVNTRDGLSLALADGIPGLFRRYNFWRSAKTLVPFNKCCGEMVARLGPASLYLPSDEPHPLVTPNIRTGSEHFQGLEIFHYGFLRKSEAFVKKSKVVQEAFFGSVDTRIAEAHGKHEKWSDHDFFDGEPLRDFIGEHPPIVRQWLVDRGYSL
jgi:glycosyl transferase family 2